MIETLLEAERLLLMGMLDQAERLYRRTVDADPRNAMALVGLARVAVERADDRQAYELACAALRVDPQNAAALRLEARLSEVMTVRGEAVERPAWLDTGAPAPAEPAVVQPAAAEPASRAENGTVADTEDLGTLAQRTVFARNPSMTDHRRMNEQQSSVEQQPPPPGERPADAGTDPAATPARRSLLRRLLGR